MDEGLELLPEEECRRLVQAHRVGRLAFVVEGVPLVVPVNYLLDEGSILLRTASGAKLRAANAQQIASFQVDEVDPVYHRGWSVLAVGRLAVVTDPTAIARLARLPVRPWASGARDHLVRLRIEMWSGRRLRHDA